MFYKKERADKIANELKSLIVRKSIKFSKMEVKKGFYRNPKEAEESSEEYVDFDLKKDMLTGWDTYYFLKTDIILDEEFTNNDVIFSLDFLNDEWNPTAVQCLAFVDGVAVQGIDGNHTAFILHNAMEDKKTYTLELQLYTGDKIYKDEELEFKLKASLKIINKEIEKLYYHIKVPIWIIENLNKEDNTIIQIENILRDTINLLDLRDTESDEFLESVNRAVSYIEKALYEDLAGYEDIIATCVGHTHIDVAWLWTTEQTKQKVARSFSTVLKLMEEYPEYKFMSSQPQLYKYLKENYREIYDRVKEKVKEGKWEAEGAMWLEADCNLASGESLVRQLLHGRKFFKEEFNKENKILWLPDVFGYSAALPQILKKSGIDYFMTTKISWNQYNKPSYDTFSWRGIDGSEVFTHFITTTQKKSEEGWLTEYNGMLYPKSLIRGWERYQQKDINNDILISYGYGDGGGGPTREMLEVGKRLQKGVKGAPKVRFEHAKPYFDELYERVDKDRLPKWVGELYFEYHRGTYTSMGRNKRGNRKSEILYGDVEFFSAWAERLNFKYPKSEIYEAWEKILLNQFHDILPGSSIKEVYDKTEEDYKELLENGEKLLEDSLSYIGESVGDKDDLVVFNSLSFNRSDFVLFEEGEKEIKGLKTETGKEIEVQKTYDGKVLAYVKDVPSRGYKILKPSNEEIKCKEILEIKEDGIVTPFYEIKWDKLYQFTSIFDRELNREILKENKKGNVIKVFEDKPMRFDAWDIDIYYKEKMWIMDNLESARWIEKGPLRATLEIKRRFLKSTLVQKISFYKDTNRIDFDTFIDWKQSQLLVKVEFPVEINANFATYDIQFGNVERPTHQNTSYDVAKFEVCAHKFADISEGDFGVTLLNDCKYGHDINDGDVRLTLLKSGIMPYPKADQEEHVFKYAIYSHRGDFKDGNATKEGYKFNVPLYSYTVKKGAKRETFEESTFEINGENVFIETVKKPLEEEGVILRVYEAHNKRGIHNIKSSLNFNKAYECDLMERKIKEINMEDRTFSFEIKPYEIKTFLLK